MTEIAGGHGQAADMAQDLQPWDPRKVGRYWLLGRLGCGGMGVVFLGRSPGGRLVAVKVVRSELAGEAEFRNRFAREVAAARTVSGLFTAAVVDADTDAPVPWLATAFVPGLSLADTVTKHGPLPARSVLAMAAGLAEGLGAIHAAGIVHRDMKPSNVLLAEDGPRIIDFGISQAAEASMLTGTGLVFGSPGFMSPEQAKGLRVGPPSDVFSLGSVLTFAATGEGPFGAAPSATLLYRVVFNPPDTTGLPAALRPLVERCLAKDPEQRPTTEELLAELNTGPPAEGWLPASITDAFRSLLPAEPGPAAPTPPDGLSTPPVTRSVTPPWPGTTGGTSRTERPDRSRIGLAGATAVIAALLIAYLMVAMTGHFPPFSTAPAAPASPSASTTTAATPADPRPSPPVASSAPYHATYPATSPRTSPATSRTASPPSSPTISPSTSPPTSPATSATTSPPSSPTTTEPASPAASPAVQG